MSQNPVFLTSHRKYVEIKQKFVIPSKILWHVGLFWIKIGITGVLLLGMASPQMTRQPHARYHMFLITPFLKYRAMAISSQDYVRWHTFFSGRQILVRLQLFISHDGDSVVSRWQGGQNQRLSSGIYSTMDRPTCRYNFIHTKALSKRLLEPESDESFLTLDETSPNDLSTSDGWTIVGPKTHKPKNVRMVCPFRIRKCQNDARNRDIKWNSHR